MQPEERRNYILDRLKENEKVEIEELEKVLNVSSMTIRRDLKHLEAEDKIIRTHGGAILKEPLVMESPFKTKKEKNIKEKQQIAEKAVQLIKNHSTVILDSGTTNLEIAKRIKQKEGLTVFTNDIKIAAELMESDIRVIVTGGELQNNVGALFGPLTENLLKDIHVDIFFLGAHAVHLDVGVMAPTLEKAKLKRLMINASDATWLVTDSSKINQKSLIKVCDIQDIDGVITDSNIPKDIEEEFKQKTQVIQAANRREMK